MPKLALINSLLPAEMLERVFYLLPPTDLKMAMLVCRWWSEVGEAPGLWDWVGLGVDEENIGYMPEMLDRRFKAVRRVKLWTVSEKVMKAMVRHPWMKEMDAEFTSLSSLDPKLLAKAVTQLEEVQLSGTQLTPQQVEAIFAAIDKSSLLKVLKICGNNLSSVNPVVMARGVNKLETVDLRHTSMKRQQMTQVLTQSLVATSLRKLKLKGNEKVDEDLYRRAQQVIPNLTSVYIQYL